VWFKRSKIWSVRILLLLVILLLGGLNVVGCAPGGSQPKGWSGGAIVENTLFLGSMEGKLVAVDISDGARLWEVPLVFSKPTSGGFGCGAPASSVAIYGTPAVSGDLVYVGGYVQDGNIPRGKVYAYNFGRDEPRWVYPREGFLDGPVVGGLVVSQGAVYFGGSDGKVYALDAVDGHKIGEFKTGDKIWSTPAVEENTVYIGSFDKKLHILDAATLKPARWKEFEAEGAIAATPLVYEGTIYFGSFDRYLYAVDAIDGSLRWKFMAESWFWARPVVYNNTIYAPALDNKVYIFNAETGDKIAEFDLESPISSSPVLIQDKVIIASEAGKIYSLDTANNQIRMLGDLEEKVYAPLSASEGNVYVHTEKDGLYAVEVETGAVREYHFE
jgi:outer membrane protein assembly factor BamB